ncbi:hypothetical protein PENSPDRAFT_754618 [Peniophora sp. CONT]|nr:hypothetical protein PENSPDRAFT_754618 [Peniophora sp. CONT]
MTDWESPQTLGLQASALQKLAFGLFGLYLYEFTTSLTFDWWLIFKKESQRRSLLAQSVKWLYIACRLLGLIASIGIVASSTPSEKLPCSAINKTVNIASLFGIIAATTLLFVRVGSVWRWDKRVTVVFLLMLTANTALSIYSTVQIRSFYQFVSITTPACPISGFNSNIPNVFMNLVTDTGLLCMLFIGLRRWGDARAFGLWNLLWNQGLIYVALFVIVDLPFLVFLFLDLNGIISIMFSLPPALILPIAATRFYRSLTSFTDSRQTYETISIPPAPSRPKPASTLRKPYLNLAFHRRGVEDNANVDESLSAQTFVVILTVESRRASAG